MSNHQKTDVDQARDDLMSHIHRCGVLKATPEHRAEWLAETVEYLGECYPSLTEEQRGELKMIGERFCQPVIPHGKGNTALSVQADDESGAESESNEETAGSEMAAV